MELGVRTPGGLAYLSSKTTTFNVDALFPSLPSQLVRPLPNFNERLTLGFYFRLLFWGGTDEVAWD